MKCFDARKGSLHGMLVAGVFAVGIHPSLLHAETLQVLVRDLLQNDEVIKAAKADLNRSRNALRQSWGDWAPTVDITANYGDESMNKDGSVDTHLETGKFQVEVKQLLWDFGKTNSSIRSAEKQLRLMEVTYAQTEQSKILEAAITYLNVLKANELLGYARKYESNVRAINGQEEARVARGSGYSTDVLQAKRQLAGAMASTASRQGSMVMAVNAYNQLFGAVPDVTKLKKPVTPMGYLPKKLDEAISIAVAKNPQLVMSRINVDLAKEGKAVAISKFAPKFEASFKEQNKRGDAGTAGSKDEYLSKVELTFPIFSGGKDYFEYKSSLEGITAAEERLKESVSTTEKAVRDYWQTLSTKRTVADFSWNEANIAAEMLTKAQEARQMKQIDVNTMLQNENSYLQALSGASTAETDLSQTVYSVLFALGGLTLDVIDNPAPKAAAPAAPAAPKAAAPAAPKAAAPAAPKAAAPAAPKAAAPAANKTK